MTDRLSPDLFRARLEKTFSLSPFARRLVAARPALADALQASGEAAIDRHAMRAALAPIAADDGERLRRALRELRARTMLTLAHRDLNGLAPLSEVFATTTALAEVAIGAAVDEAQRAEARTGAHPRARPDGRAGALIVVGMGKLGGAELNVSSDVDLVFLHGEDGETGGAHALSHHEFFSRVGKRAIATLADITQDGYVFRVDMRLRPFGDSGPLVASLGSLENYFVGHARPWERYAWLKARTIGADLDERELAAIVEPFVYRRYLDFGLLDSLRDLHARIQSEASRRGREDDIKVGAGGIREIEFAVQLFQLVRGGRDAGLRLTGTRAALAAIRGRELLPPQRANALEHAYDFLRRLEHRLQYYDDQQTQALPVAPEHRAAIAHAMDFEDHDALMAALDGHRAAVQEAFNALFDRRPLAGAAALVARLTDPQATPDEDGLVEDLRAAGLADPAPVARRLAAFVRSRLYRALSTASRAKVERLVPAAIEAAVHEDPGSDTALRLLDLIEAIDRREAYLALLVEHPQVLARAARLAHRSRWAAGLLARHPILLDELTRSAASFTATDWATERADLLAECAQHAGDTERILDLLRHFKQRHVLRFVIADLEGELPVMALSDELSALADLLLDVTLALAAAPVPGGAGTAVPAGLTIVGYGKLGGKELGYGSDLDIVFVFDDAKKPDAQALARVAQRVITWLTSHTAAGVLYETDVRLRPDGAAGLLVSSLGAFRDYQLKRAWPWEHQALTRARACAGDPALGERFEAVRREVLLQPRDAAKLKAGIVAMRAKMRAEQKAGARDLKHMAGGVIDLEFCVQAIVLVHAHEYPQLLDNKGNHMLLRMAGELGIIDAAVGIAAANAYLRLREASHAAALNEVEMARVADDAFVPEREAVKKLWAAVFGEL